ncbi:uncharacterized protein LOC113218451 [Frankliniella occidentalis]|uniref:Uncharacterized protein LOC113218451 n=1 Tax=Frankliniella occidentalis TaxID=133901 RepID=A0A9C6X4S4_FRAOC|nr:uncharacterized protein LOC113218451 [Frankliniella occidentalis]
MIRVDSHDLELGILRGGDLQPAGGMADRSQQYEFRQDAANDHVLFDDVPLPGGSPVRDQPLRDPLRDQRDQRDQLSQSYPGAYNNAFADDVGFEDDDLPERRSLGGPVSVLPDYGAVSRAPLPVPTKMTSFLRLDNDFNSLPDVLCEKAEFLSFLRLLSP